MARREREGTTDYLVRQIDDRILAKARRRAEGDGKRLRDVMESLMKRYAAGELKVVEQK